MQQELSVDQGVENLIYVTEKTELHSEMPQLDQGTNDEEPEVTSQAEKVLANLKCSPLPQGWMYFETPKGLEYMRMNISTMQMLNRLRVNKDLSVTVIFSTNEELTVNDNISSFNSISDYLKSVERWPLCVGTQIDENKYSTACRGVLVGDDSYRRTQVNPRCKSCRSLRHCTATILAQKRQRVSTLQKELKRQKRTVKMADDIVIEEHDVLDNPRIKTEVIDNEDEEVHDFDEESYEMYQQHLTDPEILECSVVLEDLGSSLNNNPCFCSDCEILFPTENALDSHKMTAHSLLAAIRRNKAIKSTSKSSIASRFKFQTDSNMEISNLYNHCNKVFPDATSFLKQSDELLTRKFRHDICDLEFESEISLQKHLRPHPSLLLYCCPICFCYFKLRNNIVFHMADQHQVDTENLPQRVKSTFECWLCPKILKDNSAYNAHIRNVHYMLYNKKNHKFECQPCNLTFPSAYSEKIHRVSQHVMKTYSKSVDLDKQIMIEPLSPTITHRVSQHEIDDETSSKSVDLDKQIMIEPLSPTITHRVSQHEIEDETSSKSVDLDKQIMIEPLSPTITHRVSQHEIEDETSTKSVDLDKQIKIEPLSPTITHRVSQHEIEDETSSKTVDLDKQIMIKPLSSDDETSSKSVDLDKQIMIEPLSPTITHRVSQHEIEDETSSKSVDLDKQIMIEPLPPTITHRVSQHEIEDETSSKSVDLDKQIKIEPLSPTITHRVSQHEIDDETSSKSVDLDKQIMIEPLSPTITHRVSQHEIEDETSSKSVDLDKQIMIEPLSPTITHRVSQHEIEDETSSKSVDLDKQIRIEPLSPTITHRVSQHKIEDETSSKTVDLDKQIMIEPLSPTITHRVSQHEIEDETSSKSVDLDKQIKIEPLSPTITHLVSQHAIEDETSSKSIDLDKQIKKEPLWPTITHRVSQHAMKTYSKSVDLDKQIKIEPRK